ncbi:UNVERIFIED_CONTAM: hypothetical protein Sradi_6891100 [Sesamum radiatum]|uniref:Uncharacterized protein n=1 Tax=Sesamum radiatum TaxID=300843 RepID=A0AAW2JJ41_SESRA
MTELVQEGGDDGGEGLPAMGQTSNDKGKEGGEIVEIGGRGVREEFQARKGSKREAIREGSRGDSGVAGGGPDNGDWGGWRRGLKVGGAL